MNEIADMSREADLECVAVEMYPATDAMLDALEDRTLEIRVRAVLRLITAAIALAGVAMALYYYPEIKWLFAPY